MKAKYLVKPGFSPDKHFTFGREYQVLADYRQRQSGQVVRDNGLVVVDDLGAHNMLFPNQVEIIDDGTPCYTFSYSQ